MTATVLALADPNWDAVVSRLPNGDLFFGAVYHAANLPDGTTAVGFVYREDDKILFHPALRRPVDLMPGAHDIETAYGYGGVASNSKDPEFLDRAWKAWNGWCGEEGVIAEFVRLHPLLDNHELLSGHANLSVDRDTVVVPLDAEAEVIWSRHQGRHRTAVRHAEKMGVEIAVETLAKSTAEFYAMYTKTMSRLSADESFYFNLDSFQRLSTLGENAEVVWAMRDGQRLAGALLLYGQRFCHYHLSGATDAGRKECATNLVIDVSWRRAKARGREALHLGGGRTRADDDALLRFKSSISPDRRIFRIASIIHDPVRYADMATVWSEKFQRTPPPGRVLFWR